MKEVRHEPLQGRVGVYQQVERAGVTSSTTADRPTKQRTELSDNTRGDPSSCRAVAAREDAPRRGDTHLTLVHMAASFLIAGDDAHGAVGNEKNDEQLEAGSAESW